MKFIDLSREKYEVAGTSYSAIIPLEHLGVPYKYHGTNL